MHIIGADLNFEVFAGCVNDSSMDRTITIRFWIGNVIIKFFRNMIPETIYNT